jgi:dTDP-4-amino-4,6-dideoxygalactose transaminase
MSELNAAIGLLQLKHVGQAIVRRRQIDATYRELLKDVKGVRCLRDAGGNAANYSYFPILVEPEYPISRDALYQRLKEQNIFTRRYFYPLISDFPMYRGMPSARRENLPVATEAAFKILCLPIYPELTKDNQNIIVKLIAAS